MSRQDTQSAEQWVNQKEVFTISVLIHCFEVKWSLTFETHFLSESCLNDTINEDQSW